VWVHQLEMLSPGTESFQIDFSYYPTGLYTLKVVFSDQYRIVKRIARF